ncbi:MAG: ACP S-malonyltransferase [Chitinophagales bacterium]
MEIGFVFPGQGAQRVGMGKEICQQYKEAAEVFARADEALGYQMSTICFEGPQEKLDKTCITQPALLTTSIALVKVLEAHGLEPDLTAGLSLGEYTALVAASALDFEDAVRLVEYRGSLMQTAVPPGEGAMAAIIGLNDLVIAGVCAGYEGIVDVANYNCPGQVVISGETEAVTSVSAILRQEGGKVIPLKVSVPSHCRLMEKAAGKLEERLNQVNWRQPTVGVVSNVNARENSSSDYKELLVHQLYSPVKWEQSVRYMMDRVDCLLEVGPGGVLSGFIKKIDRTRWLGQVEDCRSLDGVLKKMEEL